MSEETGYNSNQKYNVTKYTGTWQILYNDSTHGLQIISSDNILENDTSKVLYLKGKDGYNKLVSTLNTMSEYYINAAYAIDARSVGSNPLNKAGESAYYESKYDYIEEYSHNMITSDTTYVTDINSMTLAGVKAIYKTYWLASRYISEYDSFVRFVARNASTSGGAVTSYYLWYLNSGGAITANTYSYGVRPIIILKPDIKVKNSRETINGKTVWDLVVE